MEGMNSFLVLHLDRNSETKFWITLLQHVKKSGRAARLESDYGGRRGPVRRAVSMGAGPCLRGLHEQAERAS